MSVFDDFLTQREQGARIAELEREVEISELEIAQLTRELESARSLAVDRDQRLARVHDLASEIADEDYPEFDPDLRIRQIIALTRGRDNS